MHSEAVVIFARFHFAGSRPLIQWLSFIIGLSVGVGIAIIICVIILLIYCCCPSSRCSRKSECSLFFVHGQLQFSWSSNVSRMHIFVGPDSIGHLPRYSSWKPKIIGVGSRLQYYIDHKYYNIAVVARYGSV